MTVRVAEPPPGEAAEVDFGVLGVWFDPLLERRRRIYGLLVTLCFSRYAFLAISLRQDLAAVLDGLESAWVFFGGVVKRLVEDNLKPVVTRADRYAPGIDRVFLEYAQFRGFVVDPALEREPGPTEARRRSLAAGALRASARELRPSPHDGGAPWRSPLIWFVASSACAWAACCPRCPTAPPTRARPNSPRWSSSNSCSRTRSIAATAKAWSGASRPPASKSP